MAAISDLRRQAALGNEESMVLLLHRAIAHKQVPVKVALSPSAPRSTELRIQLLTGGDRPTLLTLLGRELTTWKQPTFQSVTIIGTDPRGEPWEQWIDLNADPGVATSLSAILGQPRSGQAASSSRPPTAVSWWNSATLRAIAASLLLALLLSFSQQLTFLFSPFITLVHELGHAACAWLFGYFALPAFDFIHGGGVTMRSEVRNPLIQGGVVALYGYLVYLNWHNHREARVLLGLGIGYLVCALTPIHQALITGMGHGSELLFSGIFLYRMLSGWGCQYSIERPLYGMLGWFTLFYDIKFAYQLLHDSEILAVYLEGKGGVMDNDFTILALEYFNTNLNGLLYAFMIMACAVPLLVFGIFYLRHGRRSASLSSISQD